MNEWHLKKGNVLDQALFKRRWILKNHKAPQKWIILECAFDIRMHEGEKIELFDKPASTSKIPYALYKATDASVVTVDFVRSSDLSWEIQFKEITSFNQQLYSEKDFLKLANAHLEQKIFENPCDYFFFQNRYK